MTFKVVLLGAEPYALQVGFEPATQAVVISFVPGTAEKLHEDEATYISLQGRAALEALRATLDRADQIMQLHEKGHHGTKH